MPTAIDLFSGAGGLGIGLELAGFKTVLAVETDQDACNTYKAALPHVPVHRGDVRELNFKKWKGIDLIAGGPPCQPFSTGGRRQGRLDCRDHLPTFVQAVVDARPRMFLLENVPGLASAAHQSYLSEVLSPLLSLYCITGPIVLNTADYGVPQSRKRLIIVGTLEDEVRLQPPGLARRLPSGEVVGTKVNGEPNTAKIVYAKTPDLRPNPYHGQLFNGGGRPLDLDAPAPTILASAGGNKTHFLDVGGHVPTYHRQLLRGGKPRRGELPEARRLTVAECAALQTFPDGMQFSGSRSSQYKQVGNAVPPRFAAMLGESMIRTLGRLRRAKSRQAVLA